METRQGAEHETAVFGGGCFWCTDAVLSEIDGVLEVSPGYSGGDVPNPTYADVCTGKTGHAECTRVVFDPHKVSYDTLLMIFFKTHDPTTLNRQGHDVGPQYRSIIFTTTPDQQREAGLAIAELERMKVYSDPIVTQVRPLDVFYPAEADHRRYYEENPNQGYCTFVISPKMEKFRKAFSAYLRPEVKARLQAPAAPKP